MARTTPAVDVQVVAPFNSSNARFRIRLIDFDTANADLTDQHKKWLSSTMELVKPNSSYHTWVLGYASRLGDPDFNLQLSYQRMQSVDKFMQALDSRWVSASGGHFIARGSTVSDGGINDNDPVWRAVEVHIFIGDVPPPLPPGGLWAPYHPLKPLLPGGPRFTEWAIASPGGVTLSSPNPRIPGAVGANLFYIKNVKTQEVRMYLHASGGAGASQGLPSFGKFVGITKAIINTALTAPQLAMTNSYTNVTSGYPITWAEIENSWVAIGSVGVGFVAGYSAAIIGFRTVVTHYDSYYHYQLIVAAPSSENIFSFTTHGWDWQLGGSISLVIGKLWLLK